MLAGRAVLDLPIDGLSRKDWLKRALALGERLYFSGEIEDRESLSKHKLENALQALRDHELVQLTSKGNVEPAKSATGALEAWIAQLGAYLR